MSRARRAVPGCSVAMGRLVLARFPSQRLGFIAIGWRANVLARSCVRIRVRLVLSSHLRTCRNGGMLHNVSTKLVISDP